MFTRLTVLSIAAVGSSLSFGCGRPLPAAAPAPAASAGPVFAQAARDLVGTWQCQGAIHGPDGASPSEVALDVGLVLDGTWIRTAFVVTSGKYPYQFQSLRAFDAKSSEWVNVIVDNMAGHALSRSREGVTWTGESHGPMGKLVIRDTDTLEPSGSLHLLGQYSLDGSSWSTGYDVSCQRS
jgi:hypothetical protein